MYLHKGLLALFILTFIGCKQDNGADIRYLYVNHYKLECNSFSLSLCLQTRSSQNEEWTYFSSPIEGFDYEWGYVYKLKIKVEEIENPPQDSSSLRYTLLELVEKTQESADSLFEVSASRAPGLVVKETDDLYTLYGEKQFLCAVEQCQTIDSLITQDFAMLFEFHHQNNPSDPLVLSQIKCSDARESFRVSCL